MQDENQKGKKGMQKQNSTQGNTGQDQRFPFNQNQGAKDQESG